MEWNGGFGRIKEERKKLSFFKIFQSADLSSECMRALPYKFMQNLSEKDFSYKMVIRAQWGSSWEVDISKNPRFYYMDKSGWYQFVSDNALGESEFITFTHMGLMCFNVNIYDLSGKEIVTPRKALPTSGIKREEGESSYKDVKKEEETCESMDGVQLEEATKKKAEASKTYKKKKKVEVGESSRGGKKNRIKKVKKGVAEFEITIRKSYLKFLVIPRVFEEHIPRDSEYTIRHHSERKSSWKVHCLVRENRTVFSSGWSRLAREFPLKVGDRCTFKLIKPTEFVLITKKSRKEITVVD